MYRCARPTCHPQSSREQYVLAVSSTDDERSAASCKKDLYETLRCMLSSGSGRYTSMSLYSISCARTLISSYDELVLSNGKKDDSNSSTKA